MGFLSPFGEGREGEWKKCYLLYIKTPVQTDSPDGATFDDTIAKLL